MNALMDFGGGVNWIWIIIIGGLAGWIAEKVMRTDHGMIMNIIVGIIGSLIGDRVVRLLDIRVGEVLPGWFLSNLLVSAAGAIILLFILKAVRGRA